MGWRVIITVDPVGAFSHVDADDAARIVRNEFQALVRTSPILTDLIDMIAIENTEES